MDDASVHDAGVIDALCLPCFHCLHAARRGACMWWMGVEQEELGARLTSRIIADVIDGVSTGPYGHWLCECICVWSVHTPDVPSPTSSLAIATVYRLAISQGNSVQRMQWDTLNVLTSHQVIPALADSVKPRPHQQQCRSNIRLCRKNRSTCSIRQCCFDIVAGVDGALYAHQTRVMNVTTNDKQRSTLGAKIK